MKLKEIKDVLDSDIPDDSKRYAILKLIAKDENAIPDILEILDYERKSKKALLENINLLLSKAHVGLEVAKYDKNSLNSDGFIQREIMQFYLDNKGTIGHCFKNMDKLTNSNTLVN
jgi:hypothetical protein